MARTTRKTQAKAPKTSSLSSKANAIAKKGGLLGMAVSAVKGAVAKTGTKSQTGAVIKSQPNVATTSNNMTNWGSGTNKANTGSKPLTPSTPRVGVSSPGALAIAQGTSAPRVGVSASSSPVLPARNDMQANGGAGYNRASSSGANPDSVLSSFNSQGSSQTTPTNNLGMNASSVPRSNVVDTNTLGVNNSKITVPEPTATDYSALIPAPIIAPEQTATQETDKALKDYLKSLEGVPSSEDAYAKAQKETQILKKQKLVTDLTGQLNAIVSKGQANQLAQVGQGRGIPEAIIGGIQAQIGRETAIAALPVQAQLSAAQGDLEMANENLDTLFKIYSDDAEREYSIRKEQKKVVYDIATAKEKRALEVADKLEERAYNQTQKLITTKTDIAKEAAKNGASASILTKIAGATNLIDAVSAAGKYMQNPQEVELRNAQIAKAWADAKQTDTSSGALTEAQLTKIDTSPQGKKLVSLSGLYQKSKTYKNLVDTYGFKAEGEAKSLIDRAYADLKISYKEAANLGALTGPDVALLEEAIKPTSGGAIAYLNYKLAGGKEGISSTIDTGLKKAQAEALMNYKQLTSRNPGYGGSEYVRSLISPFATDYNAVDLETAEAGQIIQTEDGILLEALGGGKFTPL